MRSLHPRRLTLLFFSLLLLSTAGITSAQTVTLHFWFSATPEKQAIEEAIIQDFEAEHPHINIEFLNVPWGEYHDKLLVASATGLDLDIVWGSSAWTRQFAQNNMIENLQSYFDRDLNIEDYYEAALVDSRVPATPAGDLYGLNPIWVGNVAYYNKRIFDEGGVAYPTDEWTWSDMKEAGQKLTKDTNNDGVNDIWGLGNMAYTDAGTFWWENGGELFNEGYTRSTLGSPEVADATHFLRDLYASNIISNQSFYGSVKDESNQVAYDIDGSYLMPSFTNLPFEWDVAPVPVKEAGGPRWSYAGNNPYYIWKSSDYKQEAWEFIKYRSSPEVQLKHPTPGEGPSLRALEPGSPYWDQPWAPEHYTEVMITTAQAYRGYAWGAPNWSRWVGVLSSGLNQILLGEIPVDSGLENLAEQITVIVNEGTTEGN